MLDVQHKEWFIATLLPNIRGSLMQQNIESQVEVLEFPMKLEASSIGDSVVGMVHIQSHLANLTI